MKIYVMPRKNLLNIKGTEVEFETLQKHNIISINTPDWGTHKAEEETPPFSEENLKAKNLLAVWFHDITRITHDNDVPISDEQANQMAEFIRTMDKSKDLIVHCSAGISRSGAVGAVANDFLNQDNKEDFSFFWKTNIQIQPNSLVATKVRRALGIEFR